MLKSFFSALTNNVTEGLLKLSALSISPPLTLFLLKWLCSLIRDDLVLSFHGIYAHSSSKAVAIRGRAEILKSFTANPHLKVINKQSKALEDAIAVKNFGAKIRYLRSVGK